MTKVIRKWFWVWDQEKEMAFLKAQAQKGYLLSSVAIGKYTFTLEQPSEKVYQSDFKGLNRHLSESDYLTLYRETGREYIGNTGGWYYFCRDFSDGQIEIYNDNDSKLMLYRRLIFFLLLVGWPLYFQLVFILPNMHQEQIAFIITLILMGIAILHAYGLFRLIRVYYRIKGQVKE